MTMTGQSRFVSRFAGAAIVTSAWRHWRQLPATRHQAKLSRKLGAEFGEASGLQARRRERDRAEKEHRQQCEIAFHARPGVMRFARS